MSRMMDIQRGHDNLRCQNNSRDRVYQSLFDERRSLERILKSDEELREETCHTTNHISTLIEREEEDLEEVGTTSLIFHHMHSRLEEEMERGTAEIEELRREVVEAENEFKACQTAVRLSRQELKNEKDNLVTIKRDVAQKRVQKEKRLHMIDKMILKAEVQSENRKRMLADTMSMLANPTDNEATNHFPGKEGFDKVSLSSQTTSQHPEKRKKKRRKKERLMLVKKLGQMEGILTSFRQLLGTEDSDEILNLLRKREEEKDDMEKISNDTRLKIKILK